MRNVLTEIQIKSAKATGKAYRLSDGGGLELYVSPNGEKSWRLRVRRNGKDTSKKLGNYPDVSLKEARALAKECSSPAPESSVSPAMNDVIREWIAANKNAWSGSYIGTIMQRIDRDITNDIIGSMPIAAMMK